MYEQAKNKKPERWSDDIRNWEPIAEVYLKPEKQDQGLVEKKRHKFKLWATILLANVVINPCFLTFVNNWEVVSSLKNNPPFFYLKETLALS